jgi:hypothetical protein
MHFKSQAVFKNITRVHFNIFTFNFNPLFL